MVIDIEVSDGFALQLGADNAVVARDLDGGGLVLIPVHRHDRVAAGVEFPIGEDRNAHRLVSPSHGERRLSPDEIPTFGRFSVVFSVGDLIMARRQLLNIKRLAELRSRGGLGTG